MAKPAAEPRVTTEDLRQKLGAIQEQITARTRKKVLGISYLALGGIAVGAGALGVAFWLGRRSARTAAAAAEETYIGMERSQLRRMAPPGRRLNQVVEPVVDRALRSAVNAIADRLTHHETERTEP